MTEEIHKKLYLGDCLEVLPTLPDNSIDSIVTDPPYGLSFMGKDWDHGVPGEHFWREAIRVAKPGAHLLAFGGTRTFHRLAVAIEDAGWEIRDTVMWIYGSGFPKSLDVSKAIDKCNGETGRLLKFTAWMRTTGLKSSEIDRITETNMGGHYLTAASQPAIPTAELWAKLRPHCGDVPAWVDELVDRIEAERDVVGNDTKARSTAGNSALPTMGGKTVYKSWDITAPATEAAKQWQGWGTSLKPAFEPVIVARKPLIGTVAANVMQHGTGAMNIDGCRVGTDGGEKRGEKREGTSFDVRSWESTPLNAGRWPANLVHDGSEEVVSLFPVTTAAKKTVKDPNGTMGYHGGASGLPGVVSGHDDNGGSAARFFYCAKSSKRDRGAGNNHATVKPTKLMRYLCRLVTPPGGIVLDPFMGSGSTGKAAMLEGFDFIGIELNAEYLDIARARIDDALTHYLLEN